MSVLIRGMEMPEDDCAAFRSVIVCNQWVDGEIKMYAHDFYTNEFIGEVINVPPHGRLIDVDEIIKDDHQHYDYLSDSFYVTVRDIELAPTVIEAEEVSE